MPFIVIVFLPARHEKYKGIAQVLYIIFFKKPLASINCAISQKSWACFISNKFNIELVPALEIGGHEVAVPHNRHRRTLEIIEAVATGRSDK